MLTWAYYAALSVFCLSQKIPQSFTIFWCSALAPLRRLALFAPICNNRDAHIGLLCCALGFLFGTKIPQPLTIFWCSALAPLRRLALFAPICNNRDAHIGLLCCALGFLFGCRICRHTLFYGVTSLSSLWCGRMGDRSKIHSAPRRRCRSDSLGRRASSTSEPSSRRYLRVWPPPFCPCEQVALR